VLDKQEYVCTSRTKLLNTFVIYNR